MTRVESAEFQGNTSIAYQLQLGILGTSINNHSGFMFTARQ